MVLNSLQGDRQCTLAMQERFGTLSTRARLAKLYPEAELDTSSLSAPAACIPLLQIFGGTARMCLSGIRFAPVVTNLSSPHLVY